MEEEEWKKGVSGMTFFSLIYYIEELQLKLITLKLATILYFGEVGLLLDKLDPHMSFSPFYAFFGHESP